MAPVCFGGHTHAGFPEQPSASHHAFHASRRNLAETNVLIDAAAASIVPQDLDGQLHVLHPAILWSTFKEPGQR